MIQQPARIGTVCCAIGGVSAAIISYELVLMQILSIVQWYHFASMIISVALLGFGASGTILAFCSAWLSQRFERALPVVLVATGGAMPAALWCSQAAPFRFDSYLLFTGQSHLWRLLLTYLIFFVPFVLGALAIGLCFVALTRHIGRLYCANLLGSGAGAVILVGLMWVLYPGQIVAVASFICMISGILVMRAGPLLKVSAGAISCMVPVLSFLNPPGLHLSEFKDIRRALDLPDARIVCEEISPGGWMQIVSSPAQRYAPGASLVYRQDVPCPDAVFINGDWTGPAGSGALAPVMNHTTGAVAYAMDRRDRVLLLDAATGAGLFLALDRGSREITAVEPDKRVFDVLDASVQAFAGRMKDKPAIRLLNMNSRAYLAEDTAQYDLVVLPDVGSFSGSSGLFALKEQHLLTMEAFSRIWERLGHDGALSITCWMDYPYRNPLRILATMAGVLEAKGVGDPAGHVAAIRGWATMTFVMKRSPINGDENHRIRAFCRQMLFDPAMLPGIPAEERTRYNRLADDALFALLDKIVSPDRDSVYDAYDFAVYPATDNRPYFSRFLRLKGIRNLAAVFGKARLPFFELGYVLVILTLVQVGCAAFVLIVAPLFGMGWKGEGKAGILVYFSSIAVGYMFVEIVLIHWFMLYFANPVYSASAVISVLLICSGIGSYLSAAGTVFERYLHAVIIAIILGILAAAFCLPLVFQATTPMGWSFRWIAAFMIIALLGVMMGVAFPVGITLISKKGAGSVPWAWGINGCCSVISAVLATVVAVEAGFTAVMLCAAGAYGLALLAHVIWFCRRSAP